MLTNNINFNDLLLLIKEDVQRICNIKKIYTKDFEFSYKLACLQLKKTLQKKHLKAIKKFYKLKQEEQIRFIKMRLISYIKNTNNKNYKCLHYSYKNVELKEDLVYKNNIEEELKKEEIDEELRNLPKSVLKEGLRKLVKEAVLGEVDREEIEYLCNKFNIYKNEILDKNYNIKLKKEEGGQLCLVF